MHSTVSRRAFLGTCAAGAFALANARAEPKPRKLLMIAGTPSHGPGEHEFNAGTTLLHKLLENAKVDGLTATLLLNGWPKDESVFEGVDAIFLYCDGGRGHPFFQKGRSSKIDDLMSKGVGLMCAHFAVEVLKDQGGAEFKDWLGGYYEHQYSVNPMWSPDFGEFPDHPICRGVKPFSVRDEWYFNMRWRDDDKAITHILTAKPSDAVRDGPYVYPKGPYPHIQDAKGRSETMMWAFDRKDGGSSVGFTGGHFHANWADPNFRKVVLNALLWISKVEVPKEGVGSAVSETEMKQNLDRKR